jgi:hypothetical protein
LASAAAVTADVVRHAERFARDGVQVIPRQRLARRERDRVDDAVQPVPALAESREQRLDLLVAGHVARIDRIRAELGGESQHTVFHRLALVGEGELRAFAPHGLGDAVRDRAAAQHAGHEDFLVLEEAHGCLSREQGVRLSREEGWIIAEPCGGAALPARAARRFG